jgi:hypothetical protein
MINIQEIIVFIIVGAAIILAGYRIFRSVTGKKSGCEGCASDCSGCSVMELKKKIDEAKQAKE